MSETPFLGLPLVAAGQAQKHVTINEALARLDAVAQIGVIERRAAPPSEPEEGDRHIVTATASGLWTGWEGSVAAFLGGGWLRLAPSAGWCALVADEGVMLCFDGADWVPVGALLGGIGELPALGVGTSPDEVNAFAAKLNNALWTARPVAEGGTGDLRYVMNKEGSSDVLSLLFQSGYEGRAELGLVGGDDLVLKVSADGATWHEALSVDRTTGEVSFPNTEIEGSGGGGGRELLTAARTYYVDGGTGSDGNAGLSSGAAFATIQKAVDTVASLDLGVENVTIEVAAGTYSAPVVLKKLIGAGTVTLRGDVTTPANVVVSPTGAHCFHGSGVTGYVIEGFKVTSTTSGNGIALAAGAAVSVGAMDYGAMPVGAYHLNAITGSVITVTANYTISGGATAHMLATGGGQVWCSGRTVTVTANVTFGTTFALVSRLGYMQVNANTYSLGAFTVTGSRFLVDINGVLFTNGGGVNYFPGTVAGTETTATGGRYI